MSVHAVKLANTLTNRNHGEYADTVRLSRPIYQYKMDKDCQMLRGGTNSCNFAIYDSFGMSNMRFVRGGRNGLKFKGDPLA